MDNPCENCPHHGNIEEQDCFCDATYADLIRHETLEKLDLMGITEADLDHGIYRGGTK